MLVAIADHPIALDLSVSAAPMRERIVERYGSFLRPPGSFAPRLVLEVRVDPERRPERYHPTHVDNPPLTARGDLERVELEGEGFEGSIDLRAGRGRATIPDSLAHLDLFVRIALGLGLLAEGGLLLHAAGVVHDRFGLAFSGPSGAGKSTLAQLCREEGRLVLADEMLAYRPAGVGARIYGSPFWRGEDLSGPAGGVFLLHHAERHELSWLPPDRALPRLLQAGGAPLALPAVQEAFFTNLGALLRRVPAYSLGFTPDAGFWAEIDRRPEFAFFRPRERTSPLGGTKETTSATPRLELPAAGAPKLPRLPSA